VCLVLEYDRNEAGRRHRILKSVQAELIDSSSCIKIDLVGNVKYPSLEREIRARGMSLSRLHARILHDVTRRGRQRYPRLLSTSTWTRSSSTSTSTGRRRCASRIHACTGSSGFAAAAGFLLLASAGATGRIDTESSDDDGGANSNNRCPAALCAFDRTISRLEGVQQRPAQTQQQTQSKRQTQSKPQTQTKPQSQSSPSTTFNINDEYELSGEVLGVGGYGKVYRARRRSDGVPVALKEIFITDGTNVNEFEQEIAALTTLSQHGGHRNVCKLYGVHRAGDVNYVALEIIDGGELLEHLVLSGPYSERTAARYVRELAEAVAYMHGANIVHADLKCENCMLSSWEDSDARLVVVDFGCAVSTDCQGLGDGVEDFHGTAAYCAPERLRDDVALPTPESDMFAIGVIVYILLTGTHPLDKRGELSDVQFEALIKSIGADESGEKLLNDLAFDHRVDGLSESSKGLMKSLMHPDPTKRMNAMQLVNHPWVQGLEASWHEMAGSDEKLRVFWQKSFRAALLRKYATSPSPDAEQRALSDANIRHIFNLIDLDANGVLDPHELRVALRQLGIEDSSCSLMIASADLDRTGGVTFEEFKQIMRKSFEKGEGVTISSRKLFKTVIMTAISGEGGVDDPSTSDKRLRRVFDVIDTDGNGVLSYEELEAFLRRFGVPQDEMKTIIFDIDLDRSGQVSWVEFLTVCRKVGEDETTCEYARNFHFLVERRPSKSSVL